MQSLSIIHGFSGCCFLAMSICLVHGMNDDFGPVTASFTLPYAPYLGIPPISFDLFSIAAVCKGLLTILIPYIQREQLAFRKAYLSFMHNSSINLELWTIISNYLMQYKHLQPSSASRPWNFTNLELYDRTFDRLTDYPPSSAILPSQDTLGLLTYFQHLMASDFAARVNIFKIQAIIDFLVNSYLDKLFLFCIDLDSSNDLDVSALGLFSEGLLQPLKAKLAEC